MKKIYTQSSLTFKEKDLLVKGFKDTYKLKKKAKDINAAKKLSNEKVIV
ncbi:hypothetical protein ACU5DF_05230 [Aliivibrio wodanis]